MVKPWNTTHLNIGETITKDVEGLTLSVSHVDRRIDPFLAGVMTETTFIYTGLHPTLADARQTCERKARDASS